MAVVQPKNLHIDTHRRLPTLQSNGLKSMKPKKDNRNRSRMVHRARMAWDDMSHNKQVKSFTLKQENSNRQPNVI